MVLTGLENLLQNPGQFKCFGRVAVLSNMASVDTGFRYTPCALQAAGLDVRMVFTPEHGFFQTAGYMQEVSGDARVCGLPMFSLYGNKKSDLSIPAQMLDEFDCLVFDLQDVGTRCYTYFSHLVLLMRQLAGTGKRLVVLDRPNPIGGTVEGPPLAKGWESFVGMLPIPMRHGLTAGEAATMARQVEGLDIDLVVSPVQGWKRGFLFDETGLQWLPASPNMPTLNTALVYPGMVFFEATNISEGRGTTAPFEFFGAPFIKDPTALAARLNDEGLPGVYFRPLFFRPRFDKFQGQTCGGCALHITDRKEFRPLLTGLFLVSVLRESFIEFRFLDRPYEFDDRGAARLLSGDSMIFDFLSGKLDFYTLKAYFRTREADFLQIRREFLLYE